jgi:REP element-mobilizing transposase RayT
MPRRKRFIPPRALVEVSARTIQARYLLRPSPELNRRFIGILARARRRYDVKVHVVTCMSNHWHALLSPKDAWHLARFMNFVQGNLAKEAGELHDWDGPFWSGRYHAVLVSEEAEVQHRRLSYCLAQGAKEGLVARPEIWPGVHCVCALRDGEPLRGVWYDRTAHCLDRRRRGEAPNLEDYASDELLVLDPLPCWEAEDLTDSEIRCRVAEIVETISREAAAERQTAGSRPSDPRHFLKVEPHHKPKTTKRSPAPLVHAGTRATRQRFRQAYGIFLQAFHDAAASLQAGRTNVAFPEGSFPPGLPFVPLLEPG